MLIQAAAENILDKNDKINHRNGGSTSFGQKYVKTPRSAHQQKNGRHYNI